MNYVFQLIIKNFREPVFLFYDSHNLLHPEAFEIMKKLWNRDRIGGVPHRYYAGNVSESATQSKSGILSFFQNIVEISNTLREKDLELYEQKNITRELLRDYVSNKDERIQDLEKSLQDCVYEKEETNYRYNQIRGVDPQWYMKFPKNPIQSGEVPE